MRGRMGSQAWGNTLLFSPAAPYLAWLFGSGQDGFISHLVWIDGDAPAAADAAVVAAGVIPAGELSRRTVQGLQAATLGLHLGLCECRRENRPRKQTPVTSRSDRSYSRLLQQFLPVQRQLYRHLNACKASTVSTVTPLDLQI